MLLERGRRGARYNRSAEHRRPRRGRDILVHSREHARARACVAADEGEGWVCLEVIIIY